MLFKTQIVHRLNEYSTSITVLFNIFLYISYLPAKLGLTYLAPPKNPGFEIYHSKLAMKPLKNASLTSSYITQSRDRRQPPE